MAGTIRPFLRAGQIDKLQPAIATLLPGRGEPLLQGIDLSEARCACVDSAAFEQAMHGIPRRENGSAMHSTWALSRR